MARRASKLLVIDTSVLRSATESADPLSTACREFLEKVRIVCHRVVVTKTVRTEWEKHVLGTEGEQMPPRATFGINWYGAMTRRGKVRPLSDQQCEPLRRAVNMLGRNRNHDIAAARKDIFLIEAALLGNYIVISRDKRARGLFAEVSGKCAVIQKILWVDPTVNCDELIQWLEEGARAVKAWQLGAKKGP